MKGPLWKRLPRSLLGGCFFVLYGLGSLAIGGLLFPPLALVGARRAMRALVRAGWRLFVWGGRWTGLFRIVISPADRARLATARGYVVVANHLTLIDIVVLMALLPDATAVAKAAARGNFFYSRIVRGMFLVNDDPLRVLEEAKKVLAQGVDLVVFPQGTRVPAGAPRRPLRRGAGPARPDCVRPARSREGPAVARPRRAHDRLDPARRRADSRPGGRSKLRPSRRLCNGNPRRRRRPHGNDPHAVGAVGEARPWIRHGGFYEPGCTHFGNVSPDFIEASPRNMITARSGRAGLAVHGGLW